MRRDELDELHYIALLSNVPSICKLGILSHRRVEKITHESVAMREIQDRRAKIVVPGGRRLHEYVNLYVCARNPMLYKRQSRHAELCVLRINPSILDLPGVVVTDGNASSNYVRFAAAPDGLRIINRELTFAEYWTDPDDIIEKLTDLFMRTTTQQAELIATVHFAASSLTGKVQEKPSEADVLAEVMQWKQKRRPPLNEAEVALAIRHL